MHLCGVRSGGFRPLSFAPFAVAPRKVVALRSWRSLGLLARFFAPLRGRPFGPPGPPALWPSVPAPRSPAPRTLAPARLRPGALGPLGRAPAPAALPGSWLAGRSLPGGLPPRLRRGGALAPLGLSSRPRAHKGHKKPEVPGLRLLPSPLPNRLDILRQPCYDIRR